MAEGKMAEGKIIDIETKAEVPAKVGVPTFRPSGLGRAVLCEASVRMATLYPETEAGEDAREGTLLHEILAGSIPEPADLEDEQKEALNRCREYVKGHEEGAIAIYCEEEYPLDFLGWRMLAHPDRVIVLEGNRGRIIDFKFGRNPIPEAALTMQLYTYALAVGTKLGLAEVEVYVYQVRLGIERFARVTEEDMVETNDEIADLYERCVQSPVMIFNASHEACIACHCPALKFCPAARAQLELIPKNIKDEIHAIDTASLKLAIDKLDILEDIRTEARRELKSRILAGDQVDGWGFQKRSGQRVIRDIAAAYAALVPDQLTDAQFIAALKGVSVPDLEAGIVANRGGELGKNCGREILDSIPGLVEKKPDSVALVRKAKS